MHYSYSLQLLNSQFLICVCVCMYVHLSAYRPVCACVTVTRRYSVKRLNLGSQNN